MSLLGAVTREAAVRFGERPVVVAPDGTLTYAELDLAADGLARGLANLGVSEGDAVAAVVPSGGDWVVLAVALARLGAAMASVSTVSSPPERSSLIEVVHPRLIVADEGHLDGLPLRAPLAVMRAGGRGADLAVGQGQVGDLDPDDDRPVAICFTSGTTGVPKGALFRERQLRAIQRIDLGPGAEDMWDGGSPMLGSTQFAHVGMALKLPWYIRLGATLYVMSRWRAEDALRLVATHRMPTIGAVAPQLALMLRSPMMDDVDLSSVNSIIAGGAASPPALVTEARERFGADYSIRYSSTESGGVGLGTAFDAADEEALHTIGRPRPGVEARIVPDVGDGRSEDGSDDATAVGELRLRSDAMMDGYWRDPDATRAAFDDEGWLRTGDLAELRGDGCFRLAGRRTEMFIRGGYNVFPLEVEAALADLPGVSAVAVAARSDEVLGEIGVAVVVRGDGPVPDLSAVRAHAARFLPSYKLPEDVVVVDALPLTSAQKLDRAALAGLATSGPDGRKRPDVR